LRISRWQQVHQLPFQAKDRSMADSALATLSVVLLGLAPALAAAQEPGIAFDELHRWLKPGAVVWLTDAHGREIKATVRAIEPSFLEIEADGAKTFQAADVRQLVERGTRSRKKCLLWGLAGGTGAGVIAAFATRGPMSTTWCVGIAPEGVPCSPMRTGLGDEAYLLIPAGAGAGVAVGAVFASHAVGPKRVIYRAPGASTGARVSVAPAVTPRHKAVVVSFTF
jgi:hypothetical protein